jgi:hypothetical protein
VDRTCQKKYIKVHATVQEEEEILANQTNAGLKPRHGSINACNRMLYECWETDFVLCHVGAQVATVLKDHTLLNSNRSLHSQNTEIIHEVV